MALTDAVLDAANDGATAVLAWAAIHGDATSGSQTSNERIEITWDPSTGAVAVADNVPLEFTGGPSDPATHLGVWSAQTEGTFRGAAPLSGDQTFNAAGEYAVTAITLTATDETT